MLAADQRLRRPGDIATVIRRGRRIGRDGLVVHVRIAAPESPPRGGARAAFVVPKAVGPAVTRNTVRRRLRHLLREELPRLAPGTDVVVRVLPEAAGHRYEELGRQLHAALEAAARPRGTSGDGAGTRPRDGQDGRRSGG